MPLPVIRTRESRSGQQYDSLLTACEYCDCQPLYALSEGDMRCYAAAKGCRRFRLYLFPSLGDGIAADMHIEALRLLQSQQDALDFAMMPIDAILDLRDRYRAYGYAIDEDQYSALSPLTNWYADQTEPQRRRFVLNSLVPKLNRLLMALHGNQGGGSMEVALRVIDPGGLWTDGDAVKLDRFAHCVALYRHEPETRVTKLVHRYAAPENYIVIEGDDVYIAAAADDYALGMCLAALCLAEDEHIKEIDTRSREWARAKAYYDLHPLYHDDPKIMGLIEALLRPPSSRLSGDRITGFMRSELRQNTEITRQEVAAIAQRWDQYAVALAEHRFPEKWRAQPDVARLMDEATSENAHETLFQILHVCLDSDGSVPVVAYRHLPRFVTQNGRDALAQFADYLEPYLEAPDGALAALMKSAAFERWLNRRGVGAARISAFRQFAAMDDPRPMLCFYYYILAERHCGRPYRFGQLSFPSPRVLGERFAGEAALSPANYAQFERTCGTLAGDSRFQHWVAAHRFEAVEAEPTPAALFGKGDDFPPDVQFCLCKLFPFLEEAQRLALLKRLLNASPAFEIKSENSARFAHVLSSETAGALLQRLRDANIAEGGGAR